MSAPAPSQHAQRVSEHLAAGIQGSGAGSVSSRTLLRVLVRMKWTLWRRSFRKNLGKLIGTVIGVLYGAGGLVMLAMALGGAALLLDGAEADLFPLLLRGLGGLLVLAWLVLPLLAFGLDDTLDVRRFATLPRRARELQPGLFAAGAVSLPTLFSVLGVLIASVCEVLWLLTSDVAGPIGLVAAIVLMLPANLAGLALCVLLPRAILAHSASRTRSRRSRELGGILVLALGLGAVYAFSLVMQSLDGTIMQRLLPLLRTAIAVVSWTPFGALFSVPLDAAEGHGLIALAHAVIGAAGIVVLWLWWRRSIDLALGSALAGEADSGSAGVSPLVPRFVRPGPTGAVMGRALRYWRRDTRYLGAIAVLPIMLVFFVLLGVLNQGSAGTTLMLLVLLCGLSSISIMNDIGFDGPAGWVDIAAGLPARSNLWGRVAAAALIFVPGILAVTLLVPWLLGRADAIPLVVMFGFGALVSGWGVSLLIAVTMPYPTAAPGSNPLRKSGGGGANAMIASWAGMLGVWVPQIPALVLFGVGLVIHSRALQLAGGALSLLLGAITLVVGMRIAARILARRHVELFQKVRAFL